jgi:hypothetical protein
MSLASRSPHGSHLSRNLRTFLARLIVPATNRCMVNLQSDRNVECSHFSRQHYGGRSAPRRRHTRRTSEIAPNEVGQREHMVRQAWAIKAAGEIISSNRKPQRVIVNHVCDVQLCTSHTGHRLLYPFGLLPRTGPLAGRQRRGPAEGCRSSASRGPRPPTWRGGAR